MILYQVATAVSTLSPASCLHAAGWGTWGGWPPSPPARGCSAPTRSPSHEGRLRGGHRHGRRGVPVVPSLGLGLGGGDTEQQREDLHSVSVCWRISLPACNLAAANSGFQFSSFLQHTGPGRPCYLSFEPLSHILRAAAQYFFQGSTHPRRFSEVSDLSYFKEAFKKNVV